jgi:hypothetical protein
MRDLSRAFSSQKSTSQISPIKVVIVVLIIGAILFLIKNFLTGGSVFSSQSALRDAPFGLKPVSVGGATVATGGVNLSTQTINLKDVKYGGNASARATRAFGAGIYKLDIAATMPDPINVKYEVWLTGEGKPLPIDVMRGTKSSWSLSITDSDKYSKYGGVLITLQRDTSTGIAEEHVMEGSF